MGYQWTEEHGFSTLPRTLTNATRKENKKMDQTPTPLTLEELTGAWNTTAREFFETVDKSLNPRSRDVLYDKIGALGCSDSHHVLDIGSGAARHSIEIAHRFGCKVTAVDYIESYIIKARRAINEHQLEGLITAVQGDIHQLASEDGEFDFIQCRDMLPHVRNVRQAMAECSRVLKPGGHMLVYTFVETDLMEPMEAARLYRLSMFRESLSQPSVESTFVEAGFNILERDHIATEFWERDEEDGGNEMGKEFLRIARMNRSKDALIARYGQIAYETMLLYSLVYAYEMLGKFTRVAYVLSKPERAEKGR